MTEDDEIKDAQDDSDWEWENQPWTPDDGDVVHPPPYSAERQFDPENIAAALHHPDLREDLGRRPRTSQARRLVTEQQQITDELASGALTWSDEDLAGAEDAYSPMPD